MVENFTSNLFFILTLKLKLSAACQRLSAWIQPHVSSLLRSLGLAQSKQEVAFAEMCITLQFSL